MGHTASRSDEPALLERVRVGEDEAFGELFEIHVAAVRRLARGLASDPSEADDITAETFFRVLQAVRRGNGPRDNVRAYLLTVARRVAWEWHGSRRDVPVTDDELTTRAGTGSDSQTRTAEASLITRAFSSLPERWRSVLWQTEVEGEQPAVVAPHFGLSANATAALARRARLGLRAAYLQAHLATNRGADGCRAVMEKLGGYTAGSVTGTEARRIETHLRLCDSCRSMHGELLDVCSSLRAHAGVVMLLAPAAGLAASATGVGTGTVSTAAAVGAGGAGGAAAGGGLGGTVLTVGAHVKVGLVLASTAAVGTVGFAAAPLLNDYREAMDLPGDGVMRLEIAESPSDAPVTARMGPGAGLVRADTAVPMGAEADPRTVAVEPVRHQQVLEYSLPSQQVPRRPSARDESTRQQTTIPSQVDDPTPSQATPDRDPGQGGGKQRGDAGGIPTTTTTSPAMTSSPTSAPAASSTTPATTGTPGSGSPGGSPDAASPTPRPRDSAARGTAGGACRAYRPAAGATAHRFTACGVAPNEGFPPA